MSYIDGVPKTLPHILEKVADLHPDLEAVVADDGRCSYRALRDGVNRLSGSLRAAGVGPGDSVGILLANGHRWLTASLAAHWVGATVVPISSFYRRSELAHTIERTPLRLIVAQRELFGHRFDNELRQLGLVDRTGSSIGTWFWESGGEHPEGAPDPADDAVPIAADEAAVAFVLYTSGSTAAPKAIPLVHRHMVANTYEIGLRQHLRPGDRLWLASPMFFIYGCGHAHPLTLTHAATLCVQERFEVESALQFMQDERCSVYYGLPVTTHALAEHPDRGRFDLSALRTGIAAATPEERRLVIEELGVSEACTVWGMSETYGCVTMTDGWDPVELRLASEGRPLRTQSLRVVREDGSPAAVGEIGELQAKGCVIDGYLDAPDLNAEAHTADGWFRSGDLGWIDGAGETHFVGRAKEIVKAKGINISPLEVELLLVEHEAVSQAYVFGVKDDVEGEVLAAAIVPDPTVDLRGQDLPTAIRSWLRGRAATYKVPAVFEVLPAEDLPLTSTGKVSKLRLQEIVAARRSPASVER